MRAGPHFSVKYLDFYLAQLYTSQPESKKDPAELNFVIIRRGLSIEQPNLFMIPVLKKITFGQLMPVFVRESGGAVS